MKKTQLQDLNLSSLEHVYLNTQKEIKNIKHAILAILKFEITEKDDSETFIDIIKKSIASLDKQVTDSALSLALSKKNDYLKMVETELQSRRKELFANLDLDLVPLDKLSKVKSFLSNYQKESYKENISKKIYLVHKEDIITSETFIRNLPRSTRIKSCFQIPHFNPSSNTDTVGDLVSWYKNKKLPYIRNLGKISIKEIENFLKEHNFI